MICKRIHLTPRGLWIRDLLGALVALIIIPGCLLLDGKMLGL